MKNLKFKKQLLAGIIAVGTASAVTIPLLTSIHPNHKNNISVNYKGTHFSSKANLLTYIKNNSSTIHKRQGNHIYTIKNGNDIKKFDTFQDAVTFLRNKIVSHKVYLKPGNTFEKDENIDINQFIDESKTANYVAFEKFSKDSPSGSYHSYTFAQLPADDMDEETKSIINTKIEEARQDAAASYIQVHSAFFFDGKYFSNKQDVRSYITTNKNLGFEHSYASTSLLSLNTRDYGLITYDKMDKNNLIKNKNFINSISSIASPKFNTNTTQDSSKDNWIEVGQDKITDIASNLQDSDAKYVKVNSNNGKVTQIIDMDKATKSGRLFGNYFAQSGLGMEGIDNTDNWETTGDKPEQNASDLLEMSTLKATITYLFMNQKYSNPIDMMSSVYIKNSTLTLSDYLKSIPMNNGLTYLDSAMKLITDLSQGKKYNILDSLVALHSFLINNMIQNKEDVKKIDVLSQYFDQMMALLDKYLTEFLAPFFTNDNKGNYITIDPTKETFIINYFRSAFKFYDKDNPGHNIEFQNNPNAYYRKLIGHKLEEGIHNVESENRNTVFQLIKAAMGMQAISMKFVRKNAIAIDNWKQKFETYLAKREKNISTGLDPNYLNLEPKKASYGKDLDYYQFKDVFSANLGDEEMLIWNNVKAAQNYRLQALDHNNTITKNITISPSTLLKNYNDYLQKNQNKIITKSKSITEDKINELYKIYVHGDGQGHHIKTWSKRNKTEFDFSYFSFLNDLDTGTLFINNPTEKDRINSVEQMIKGTEVPFRDRFVKFMTPIATIAAKACLAVMTASVAVEGDMIKSEFSSALKEGFGSNKMKQFARRLDSRSTLFIEKSKETINQKISTSEAFKVNKDKMMNDIKKEVLSSDNSTHSDGVSRKVGDFLGACVLPIYGDSLFLKEIHEALSIAFEISFNVARNIFPGINSLIDLIKSFSSNKVTVWEYNKTKEKYFWNGDIIHYSWWGLSQDHLYTIKDLHMIHVHDIISGYTSSQSGYYYNGFIHHDLSSLKYAAALEKIKEYINKPRGDIFKKQDSRFKWEINLGNNGIIEAEKLSDLVDKAASLAIKSSISKKLFITSSGLRTNDVGKAWIDSINNMMDNLKSVLILKLPTLTNAGEEIVDSLFQLPKPYIERGKEIDFAAGETNEKYIVYNPNIVGDIDEAKLGNDNSLSAPNKNALIKVLTNLSYAGVQNNFSILKQFVSRYTKNIYVKSTNVIFQDLNTPILDSTKNTNQKLVPGSYEALVADKYSDQLETLYSFTNNDGFVQNYKNIDIALREMVKENNEMGSFLITRGNEFYKFNDQLFHTINEIYDYIIKQSQEGKHE